MVDFKIKKGINSFLYFNKEDS